MDEKRKADASYYDEKYKAATGDRETQKKLAREESLNQQKLADEKAALDDKSPKTTYTTSKQIGDSIAQAVDRSVQGVIQGTTTIKKAFNNLGQSILATFVSRGINKAADSPFDSLFSAAIASSVFGALLANSGLLTWEVAAAFETAVEQGGFRPNGEPSAAASVLIVGAGPAGLFAACELLRHGVKPRVVERRLAPHREARGTALQPAVLEALERGGLIEPFLRAGVRISCIQLLGPGLREIASEHFAYTGCAYEFQCSLPQWCTEAILREYLGSLGLEVEFGTEVKSIEDEPDGVRIALAAGGRTQSVKAAYVLGAGGAHSVTRHSMQEHLTEQTYDGRYFVGDVKVRLLCPPECGRLIVGPAGFVLFSPLPDDRWLIQS